MSRSSLPRHALALGQNKIILDMTNPWLNQANRAAQKEGVPAGYPQSSALYHQQLLDDPTASFCHSYRCLMASTLMAPS